MQWYVMHEGKTAGPVDGEEIVRLGRQGQLLPSMHVRDDSGAWMPITQSPFASVVSVPVAAAPNPPKTGGLRASAKRIAIAVAVVIGAVVGLFVIVALANRKATPPPLPAVTVAAPPQAPKPQAPSLSEKLAAAENLREAVALTKPLFADVQGEDVNPGAALLAMWWAHRSTLWNELIAMPDTRRAEVMKDPEPYRGQRICMTGSVTQIFRDKSTPASAPVYMGVLYHNGGFVRFLAARSTAAVVEDTPARFCGIVVGLQSYPNVSGGTTHAIQVVGLFDIPANGGKGLPQYDEW